MNSRSVYRDKKCLAAIITFVFVLSPLGALSEASEGLKKAPDGVTAATKKTPKLPSSEIVRLAWKASHQRDMVKLNQLIKQCLDDYGYEAKELQEELSGFPSVKEMERYQALNDVGTCLFIRAEALMNSGKTQEAIKEFEHAIKEFPLSQSWDPRTGGYWSIAEKSEASIKILNGDDEEAEEQKEPRKLIYPKLYTVGDAKIVDYQKYGEFTNVGTENYRYKITDLEGLVAAVGEGIYPSTSTIYKNPRLKELKKEGRLEGSHWDYVNTDDLEAAYFKWVTAPEPLGVRLFYTALIFEKSKMYFEAIRAYHSLIVHFPKTVAWTPWNTPWYPAQAAIAKIRHILRTHPEMDYIDKYMKIEIKNGYDNDDKNDAFITYPGRIVKKGFADKVDKFVPAIFRVSELGKEVKRVGEGTVRLVQYENGHWKMFVNDEPFVIHGMTYDPTRVGESPNKGTLENWMEQDMNKNGLADGPFDSWIDANLNNEQDEDEPVIGDFQLMKEMGVNAIRFYHIPTTPNKELLRKMYKDYGIRVIMGDFIGKYAIGSGADWFDGTDYENEEHQKNMMEEVRKMVLEHKDEPYILLWLLGNENNYGVACNANTKPEAYFKFANEVAKMIKSIDPNHPVAICNGDTLFLDKFAEFAPDIDIYTANVYRGDYGFGSFWEQVFDASGKPAFITEYGCPAFAPQLTREEGEQSQADFHLGNWMDIEENLAETKRGVGNALGGVAFEWLDEWWKNYEPYRHDRKSDTKGPFPGGFYFEEWFGLVGQGNGKHSPYMRQLRKSYFVYKELWNK